MMLGRNAWNRRQILKVLGSCCILSSLTGCSSLMKSTSNGKYIVAPQAKVIRGFHTIDDHENRFQNALQRIDKNLVHRTAVAWKNFWKSLDRKRAFQNAYDQALEFIDHLEKTDMLGSLESLALSGQFDDSDQTGEEFLRSLKQRVVDDLKEVGFSEEAAKSAIDVRLAIVQDDPARVFSVVRDKGLKHLLLEAVKKARFEVAPQMCAESFFTRPQCGGGGGSGSTSPKPPSQPPVNSCTTGATVAILFVAAEIIACALAPARCIANIDKLGKATAAVIGAAGATCAATNKP
jgi:hypothetical protein